MRSKGVENRLKVRGAVGEISIIVIRNNRPVEMTVSEVLRENTAQLVELIKRELELRERQLQEELHARTLERICQLLDGPRIS